MSKKFNKNSLTPEDKLEDEESLKEFREKKSKEILKARKRERKMELDSIRHQHKIERKKKRTTIKVFMYFILLNCTIVEAYSMFVMYQLKDLSALYSLIGAVVGESISYAIYCLKSFNDSKEEAKSLLERDKFNMEYNIKTENDEIEEDLSDEDLSDEGEV